MHEFKEDNMKPLVVLLASFVISMIVAKVFNKEYDLALFARIAMAIMLCFTAIGHFAFTKGMSMMIPPFIPYKTSIVYLTGVFEILLAVGLLIPQLKVISGWALIMFLLVMLPANVYAAVHTIDYQNATFNGHGLSYLWFRIPLQLLFIGWTYVSAIGTRL